MSTVQRKMYRALLFAAVLILTQAAMAAASWTPLGPDGGDVRSLTYDPANPDLIYLGTSSGQIFVSHDGGADWSRFARLGAGDDYVLDHILVDPVEPRTIYVSAWSVDDQASSGDVFVTHDGGKHWSALEGMHGKSVRALAMAPSDRKILVAGTRDGVYRSNDAGASWQRISPEHHPDLRNFESVAIDPKDPDTVYAGTWHLPWKTTDGGKTWHNIKKGVIDDSDVFSIIISHDNPQTVYASACSGIYRSDDGGELFHKIQGMPNTARRTRVLKQDPVKPEIVYAGTTEGLWKTFDGGKTWRRMTAPNVILNDVLVDPRHADRVVIATDRSGVMVSDDAAVSFSAANRGFTHRQVGAVLVDRDESNTLYAGVINDKEYGGVFVSRDLGAHWSQMSSGLGGRDVFTLRQAENGTLLAGTNGGVFRFDRQESRWIPINTLLVEKTVSAARKVRGKMIPAKTTTVTSEFTGRVAQLEVAKGKLLAATSGGLFTSTDFGHSWRGGPIAGDVEFISVTSGPHLLAAATAKALVVSLDGGATWYRAKVPWFVTAIYHVTADDSNLWLATREGGLMSRDGGDTWDHVMAGLPPNHVTSIFRDVEGHRLLAAANHGLYQSTDGGRSWRDADSGWAVRSLAAGRGRLFATTAYDGIVATPEPDSTATRAASGNGGGGSEE
jgi:photosystem II stability/assembly factor-like uncharacterized protein